MRLKGRRRIYRVGLRAAVILTVLVILAPGPRPTQASWQSSGATAAQAVGFSALAAAFGYFAWINRPSQQEEGKEVLSRRGPGGFYGGMFAGASLVQNADWKWAPDTTRPPPLPMSVTTPGVQFQAGAVGGLKFGYFCHNIPYLGMEGEFNFTRSYVASQTVGMSPPIGGVNRAITSLERFYVYTLAVKFVGRYGFLPDEVDPFGRLQPYVGIGPGFNVVGGRYDTAKNFSMDIQAGVRYMLLKQLSAFVEYKFSWQPEIEMEHDILTVGGVMFRGHPTFDYNTHKIVAGVTFHFW